MALAFSYYRFSSKKQEIGDSLRRQIEAGEAFAARNGLTLSKQSYRDLGVSAFDGKNLHSGALGAFINAVDEGKIPKGSYLIVESFDRVSRQNVMSAFDTFRDLLKRGIYVVTTMDGQVYSEDALNDNWTKLIQVLAYMARANDESKTKAQRVAAKWQKKREHGEILTSICPAWLRLNEQRTAWVEISDRVEVVQRIFDMAEQGIGTPTIMRRLQQNNIKTLASMNFGTKNIKCKARGCDHRFPVTYYEGIDEVNCPQCGAVNSAVTEWSPELITALLRNKSVIGYYTPKKAKNAEPVAGYYPAIIQERQFEVVQQLVSARAQTGGRNFAKMPNIFTGLLYCNCGSKMRFASKNKWQTYVRCRVAYGSTGKCNAPLHPYKAIEDFVLPFLENIMPGEKKYTPDPRPKWQAELADIKQKIVNINEALGVRVLKSLVLQLEQLEIQEEELKIKLESWLPPVDQSDVALGVNKMALEYIALRKQCESRRFTAAEQERFEEIRQGLQVRIRQMLSAIVLRSDTFASKFYEYREVVLYGPYIDDFLRMGYVEGLNVTDDGGLVLEYQLPEFGINGTRRRVKVEAV